MEMVIQFCVFLGLVELPNQSAEGVTNALLHYLHSAGFIEQFLNLIAFVSDGASVMMDATSDVAACVLKRYKNVFVFSLPQSPPRSGCI